MMCESVDGDVRLEMFLKLTRVAVGCCCCCCLSSRAETRRSASVLVISPHDGVARGITSNFFNNVNCAGVHLEQYICNSSRTEFISPRLKSFKTETRILGIHSRFSPPITKQGITQSCNSVVVYSFAVWSGGVSMGNNRHPGAGTNDGFIPSALLYL